MRLPGEPTMTTPHADPRRLPRTWAAALLAASLALPAAASERNFAANSLIIPTQMEYQTDCGMISAYGLVYTLLYKNAALVTAGRRPITIYWSIESRKQSHHRCDTRTAVAPSFSSYNDNDGCDFAIESASGQPVALLQDNNAELAPFNVYSTSYDATTGEVTRDATQVPIDASTRMVKYQGASGSSTPPTGPRCSTSCSTTRSSTSTGTAGPAAACRAPRATTTRSTSTRPASTSGRPSPGR